MSSMHGRLPGVKWKESDAMTSPTLLPGEWLPTDEDLSRQDLEPLPQMSADRQFLVDLAQVHRRLTHEQEHSLLEAARAGDVQARDRLIISLVPVLTAFAHRCRRGLRARSN